MPPEVSPHLVPGLLVRERVVSSAVDDKIQAFYQEVVDVQRTG